MTAQLRQASQSAEIAELGDCEVQGPLRGARRQIASGGEIESRAGDAEMIERKRGGEGIDEPADRPVDGIAELGRERRAVAGEAGEMALAGDAPGARPAD